MPLGRRCASPWVSAFARAPRRSPSTARERGDAVQMRRFPRPKMRRVVIVVPRLFNTGTRFGAELDSLVDVVSFGVAPAFLIYQLEFATAGQAEWIFCYF